MDPKKCPRSVNCIDAGCSTCPCAAHPDWAQTMKDAALGRNVRAFPEMMPETQIFGTSGELGYSTKQGCFVARRGSKLGRGLYPEAALKAAGLWKE